MRKLQLLAPAKNLACGIAAIDHGADAVYIGAPSHGARIAAANTLEDIRSLCDYAHCFGAEVYATVNTLVYDSEMADTLLMVAQLDAVGIDAFLVQDMGLAQRMRGKYVLHASTQCDTRTAEKVAWLRDQGFHRVVLARELSLQAIREIHQAVPDVELEAFVHGALCVSYSGVCYASQYAMGRSANRGACAQFCRLAFDLVDAEGNEIVRQRHLLSLKDMCRIDYLERLADAGVCTFKIEGRLKDEDYVKNVVSAYSQRLDKLVKSRPQDYCRASQGRVTYYFEPSLGKTFNRGYTSYFMEGVAERIASFDTPKSIGAFVGKVKEIKGNSFTVAGTASFANGDGLSFFDQDHRLQGFRVNKAEGNRLFPQRMPKELRPGLSLYRNHDEAFSRQLKGKTAERKLPLAMEFKAEPEGFSLSCMETKVMVNWPLEKAKQPQRKNICDQLTKLGNTPFVCEKLYISPGAEDYFIPNKVLTELRRKLIDRLMPISSRLFVKKQNAKTPEPDTHERVAVSKAPLKVWQPAYRDYPYLYNIANQEAKAFYVSQGLRQPVPAFELNEKHNHPLLMQCRHCVKRELGYCQRHGGKRASWREPLYLRLPGERLFRLEFRCDQCQMNIYAE